MASQRRTGLEYGARVRGSAGAVGEVADGLVLGELDSVGLEGVALEGYVERGVFETGEVEEKRTDVCG